MRHASFASLLIIALCAGCGSNAPTVQLKDARDAFQTARTSEAASLTPDKLYEAKLALDKAEEAHQDDPGSYREQSLAYIAQRQAELAVVHGRIAKAKLEEHNASEHYTELQGKMLDQSKQQVATTEKELAERENALQKSAQELEAERSARETAEARTKDALKSLQDVAKVKEDSRGTVITLDGSVLFASGQTRLLAIAERTLSDVAKALKDLDPGSSVSIIGYTDSVGSAENNQKLSEDRAQAVRSYLISQGVPETKLVAIGRGEEQPIASNDTAEGRANNRRVELVIGSGNAAAANDRSNALGTIR
ncbi:MAG TPA: OmpA family protein [Polyangiaceae bacterium]|jgi:outer membrane protein OmpA-like peptidoglycan-associated protein|nr:OmpA family protein [Polyangiaceae bacterium]